MLTIDVSRRAEKFLRGLPAKHARQLAIKLQQLRIEPEPHDSAVLKGGSVPYRRADAGEYRIICRVEADVLQVVLVGKRNDDEAYRLLRRLQQD